MLPRLEEAIKVIKAGDKAAGRQMLADILQADLNNELAWLWLSSVVDSPEEKRKYLRRVLAINPANKAAQRGLALLAQEAPDQPEPTGPAKIDYRPESPGPLLARIAARHEAQTTQSQPAEPPPHRPPRRLRWNHRWARLLRLTLTGLMTGSLPVWNWNLTLRRYLMLKSINLLSQNLSHPPLPSPVSASRFWLPGRWGCCYFAPFA